MPRIQSQRKRFISRLEKIVLLIIDEWLGNKFSEGHNFIFEIFEKRDEKLTAVFASQYNPKD